MQLAVNKMLMSAFKPRISGVGIDRSTNCATIDLPIVCVSRSLSLSPVDFDLSYSNAGVWIQS